MARRAPLVAALIAWLASAAALAQADVKEAWVRQGASPMGMSVDQFDRFLREAIVKWSTIVRLSGAKVD